MLTVVSLSKVHLIIKISRLTPVICQASLTVRPDRWSLARRFPRMIQIGLPNIKSRFCLIASLHTSRTAKNTSAVIARMNTGLLDNQMLRSIKTQIRVPKTRDNEAHTATALFHGTLNLADALGCADP